MFDRNTRFSAGRRILFAVWISIIALAPISEAQAQITAAPQQGWAGIVPGSNDYDNPVAYQNAQDACTSVQNSFVPNFGFQVFGLLQVISRGQQLDPHSGLFAAATGCVMDAGPNGTAEVISLYGCDSGFKYAEGTCLPDTYPVTAESLCDGPKGSDDQCPTVGDPVSTSTGAKVEFVTDYSSGGPNPIEIKRSYRSLLVPQAGDADGLGMGWRLNLSARRLKVENAYYNFIVRREDGTRSRFIKRDQNLFTPGPFDAESIEMFNLNGGISVQNLANSKDRFELLSGSRYQYTDERDRKDIFQADSGASGGYILTQSTWPGGYQRNYFYAANNRNHLIRIDDSYGRTINLIWSGDRITRINLPDGTSIEYSYSPKLVNGTPVAGSEALTRVARYGAGGTLIDDTTYQYDRSSASTTVPLLTGVVDASGVLVDSTIYDPIGRVLNAQGPNGVGRVTIAYDDANGARTVTNALGQREKYNMVRLSGFNTYVPSSFVVSSIEREASATVPAGAMSYNYDSRWFINQKTDWNGVVTNYTNQALGEETQRVEDANGVQRTTNTTWSSTFRLPTQIVSPELTVNLTYDTEGRLIRREELETTGRKPVSRAWNFTYNTLGLLASVTGPRTDVTQTTSYAYDASGNLASVTNALGQVTTINTVNPAGLPTSITGPNGVVTTLTYDPLSRVKTITVMGPVHATTSFGYDINGLLTSITSPEGVALTFAYDNAHRLTSISDSAGQSLAFTLDALGGHLTSRAKTSGGQVLMSNSATFDSLGRLLSRIGAASQTTNFQYDGNSNLTRVVDPRSAATQFAFDGLNRVIRTTDALNGATRLAYNGLDDLTSVTDARNNATTYTVNGFGFVTQTASPDTGVTIFTHDLAGNVLSRKDARRVVTNYTYDALDRIRTRTYPTSAENVTFTYDAVTGGNFGKGRLTSVVDEAGSASFTYDAYGNRVTESRTIAGTAYTTRYAYNLDRQVTQITYPSGLIVNYQRDSLGQIVGVTMKANAGAAAQVLASNGAYLPFGPLQGVTLGNGVQLSRSYDMDYRLTGMLATGATTLQNLTLGYDNAGNISSITDSVTPSLNQTFQYDLVGRLTQGSGLYGQDNYSYDSVGNRLSRTLVNGGTTLTSYAYGAGDNRLASSAVGGVTTAFSYNANGARITRKTGSGKNAVTVNYAYNSDGRLSSVGSAAFKYDAFGRRAIETGGAGGAAHFLFSPDGVLLAEHTAQGALVRNYIYLNGAPFATVDATGAVRYILNDHLGQPQAMLDSAGAVTWRRVAGLFGDTVSQPVGNTGDNPLRFPGQQFDAATGLHYNYFRNYDPLTGRYLEPDPIGLAGGINLYAYVGSNPVNLFDLYGLACTRAQEIAIAAAAGAAGGAVSGAIDGARAGNVLGGAALGAAIGGAAGAVSEYASNGSNNTLAGAAVGAVSGAVTSRGSFGSGVGGAAGGAIGGPAGGFIGGAVGEALSVKKYKHFRPDLARRRAGLRGGLSGLAGGLVTDLVRDQLEKLCEDDECGSE